MCARLFVLLTVVALPGFAAAAERACEQSESTVTASPQGRWSASVQHQVCDTGGGVAAAVTVYVGEAAAPLQGRRVAAIAVPRSREEWPRAVWRSESSLEVWVPNFATVLETSPGTGEVSVTLRYCGDDPEARARVAAYEGELKQWMQAVSRWAERRKSDPEGAGPRPVRPEEPRVTHRPCTDRDIAAAP
jgi:hypothetical protein